MKKPLYIALLSIFAILMIFLLLAGLGFGFRVGSTMYAAEGFGPFRTFSIFLFLILISVGARLLWRRSR
jgi:hypothetical protein